MIRFKDCSVSSCTRNAHRDAQGKLGFCSMHYQRAKRHGDPSVVKTYSPALDWIAENKDYSGDDCLKWPFHISEKDGYGRAHYPGTSKLTTASRLMCMAAHGQPPGKKYECAHSCGKGYKACVNPRHLYWTTPTENQNERVDHGTSNRGEAQGQSKLTEEDVRFIRRNLGIMSQVALARHFGVDQSHISDIKRRKVWAWLD